MNQYTVVQMANLPRCDMPGYRQWLDVFDQDGEWCGAWHFESEGTGIVPGMIKVQDRDFVTETSSEAMRKFIEWIGGS